MGSKLGGKVVAEAGKVSNIVQSFIKSGAIKRERGGSSKVLSNNVGK